MTLPILGARLERHCPDCEVSRAALPAEVCEFCAGPLKPGAIRCNGFQKERPESWPKPTHWRQSVVEALIAGELPTPRYRSE